MVFSKAPPLVPSTRCRPPPPPYAVAVFCHRVVHHAWISESRGNSFDSSSACWCLLRPTSAEAIWSHQNSWQHAKPRPPYHCSHSHSRRCQSQEQRQTWERESWTVAAEMPGYAQVLRWRGENQSNGDVHSASLKVFRATRFVLLFSDEVDYIFF